MFTKKPISGIIQKFMKIVQIESLEVPANINEKQKSIYKEMGHEFTFFNEKPKNPEELIAFAKDAEILILSNIPLSKKTLSCLPKLKYISVAFTGTDHIDIEYCKSQNIAVSNAAGYSTQAVAELALGSAIALYRDFNTAEDKLRANKGRELLSGTNLHGKTVGIIGMGAIGQATAKLFKAFSCNIVYYSRTSKPDTGYKQLGLTKLLEESDIVSVHIPLNNQTQSLLNYDKLALMKADSILINTARGPIVDYNSLSILLNESKIKGAAIDVYEIEPPIPKEHPLLKTPNTILFPHIGYATNESFENRYKIVHENIISYFSNEIKNRIA